MSQPHINPRHAEVLVCVLGLLVFTADMAVPADLNVAIFYCFVIVLCAWTCSLRFLWITAAVFTLATIPGLLLTPAPVQPLTWVDWSNRVFGMGALLLVTAFIHLRMRSFQLMESAIVAKDKAEREHRESEAQLKLAQAAGAIGSWQWNPDNESYQWSKECFEIFGIDPAESSFAAEWRRGIHSADLPIVLAAIADSRESGEFEVDYRYEHPSRGTRWIHARAKIFARNSVNSLIGVCHDVTSRKEVEAVLRQSRSLLEVLIEERTSELQKLSSELLRSQDEERRRIARELHDSLGQYLASLKINLDLLTRADPTTGRQQRNRADLLSDSLDIVQQCISETRTLSYLLHPPLLDEAGFASAARCYLEGFAKRSNIKVNAEIPDTFPRLSSAVELVLFRALQESLTNVIRYSGSPVVDVIMKAGIEEALMTVRDYGCGIPPEVLRRFREHKTGVGVGLSGMRERLNDLGGQLELASDGHGTTVAVRIPLMLRRHNQARSTSAA